MRLLLTVSALMILAGCAAPALQSTTPGEASSAEGVGRDPESAGETASQMSAAATTLLEQGRSQRLAGEYIQASATLERALRIEPSQARIWLELAKLRYDEGDFGQAEQMGRKVLSLPAADDAVRADALSLIDRSRAAAGL